MGLMAKLGNSKILATPHHVLNRMGSLYVGHERQGSPMSDPVRRFNLKCSHDGDNDFIEKDSPDGTYMYAADHQRVVGELETLLAQVKESRGRWESNCLQECDRANNLEHAHALLTQQLTDRDNAIVLLGEDVRELTLTKATLTAKLETLKTVPQIASSVSRCTCPFTPGYLVEGWKLDMKLGTDGNHKSYCPFGIAKAVADFIERTEHAYDTQKEGG